VLEHIILLTGSLGCLRKSHEYFLKIMELPALIFTEGAVIYTGKDHGDIHPGVLTVPLVDKLWPHFSASDSSKCTFRPEQT